MIDRKLGRFLDEIGERASALGAGAAAALAMGLAAALAEKAARVGDDRDAVERARELRASWSVLAEADGLLYGAALSAEGEERPRALAEAADVPLQIAEAATALEDLAESLLATAGPHPRGEALVAAELARLAARTAGALALMDLTLADSGDDPRAEAARAHAGPLAGAAEG